MDEELPIFYEQDNVINDPESTASQKICVYKDYIFEYAFLWLNLHLSSCKSYRENNHFERRLKKMDRIYNRVFDCEAEITPSPTKTTTQAPTKVSTKASTQAPTTVTVVEPDVEAVLFLAARKPLVLGLDGEFFKVSVFKFI